MSVWWWINKQRNGTTSEVLPSWFVGSSNSGLDSPSRVRLIILPNPQTVKLCQDKMPSYAKFNLFFYWIKSGGVAIKTWIIHPEINPFLRPNGWSFPPISRCPTHLNRAWKSLKSPKKSLAAYATVSATTHRCIDPCKLWQPKLPKDSGCLKHFTAIIW